MTGDQNSNEEVLMSVEGAVATLTFNRPSAFNALNYETSQKLNRMLEEISQRDEIHVVLLKGKGKAFSAGGDINMMQKIVTKGRAELNIQELLSNQARYHEGPYLLRNMPKITIAVVEGHAAGAGMSLALACDLRIASEKATFTTAFSGVGLDGDLGISWTLPRLVGESKAKELMLLQETVGADEAVRLNLVNRLFTSDQIDAEVTALARRLSTGPQLAYRYIKENINASHAEGFSDTLNREALSHAALCMSSDFFEGVSAYLEKRRPVFGKGFD